MVPVTETDTLFDEKFFRYRPQNRWISESAREAIIEKKIDTTKVYIDKISI